VSAKRKRGRYHTIPTLAKMIDINLRAYRDLHMAIIEKIKAGKPLSIVERTYTAEWLLETWLPPHEVNKLRKARYWEGIEMLIQTGMYFSPEKRKPTRDSVVARVAEVLGMSLEAVDQRLKENKTARKMRPVFARISRKRR
jgi:hypothetical protein